MPYLDVSATRGDSGLSLIVTNLHDQKAMTSQIEIRGFAGTRTASVYEINGPSMDTENSFQEPDNITIRRKPELTLAGTFEYSFSAHSITLIKAAL